MTEPMQLGLARVDQSACQHLHTERGADAPLRHGSYQTQVCTACRMFRLVGHVQPSGWEADPKSAWKPSSEYAAAVAKRDDSD